MPHVQGDPRPEEYDADTSDADLPLEAPPLSLNPVETQTSITNKRMSFVHICNPDKEESDLRPHYVSNLLGPNLDPVTKPSSVEDSTSKLFIVLADQHKLTNPQMKWTFSLLGSPRIPLTELSPASQTAFPHVKFFLPILTPDVLN